MASDWQELDSDDRPKLNKLAALSDEPKAATKRRRVLENLDALTQLCLERRRTWVTKDGTECDAADPDLRTALQAQLAGARLLGVDETTKPVIEQVDLDKLVRRARRAISARAEQQGKNAQDPTH